jgi:hypothetical protein
MILGIAGKAGAGKTTLAKIAEEYGFTRASFGQAVKEELIFFLKDRYTVFTASNLFGTPEEKEELLHLRLSPDSIFSSTSDEFNPDRFFYSKFKTLRILISGRVLMQLWGTEYRRNNFGENYWVHKCIDGLRKDTNYVIDDCRFENEFKIVDVLILVERLDYTIKDSGHASEQLADSFTAFNFVLKNSGTLKEYIGLCSYFMRSFTTK